MALFCMSRLYSAATSAVRAPVVRHTRQVAQWRAAHAVRCVHTAPVALSEAPSVPEGIRERPFRVLGVQQVAVGSTSKDRLKTLWVDALGLKHVKDFASEKENVDEAVLQAGRGPASVEVDIMQPLDANAKPAVHIPPLNHIGLWVDDIEQAVEWLDEAGVRFAPGGIRPGASGHKVCFIHPKGNHMFPLCGEGVLIELVQAPQNVIDFHDSLEDE